MRNEAMGFTEVSYEFGKITKAKPSARVDSKKVSPNFGDIILSTEGSDPVIVTRCLPCPPTIMSLRVVAQTFTVLWNSKVNEEVLSTGSLLQWRPKANKDKDPYKIAAVIGENPPWDHQFIDGSKNAELSVSQHFDATKK